MNPNDFDRRNLLDQATEGLRECEPTPTETGAAANRVWHRLEASPQAEVAAGIVHDCEGFVGMIAAYRQGTLPAARRELFEDHTRACVDCRRALWQASADRPVATRPPLRAWSPLRWGLAAAAVLVIGVGLKLGVLDRLQGSPQRAQVVVERVTGSLFRVEDGRLLPVTESQTVAASELIRTGRDARAILRLADGSRVEMNEHSELAVESRRDGVAVALRRGGVIVEAAKQGEGRHLYVDAPDCQVAVKGTVFAVTSGPKGSRVSVLEGQVWVEQGATVTKLAPGEQTATSANIAPVPVAEEVAWSSDPERYAVFLRELSEVSKQMMAKLANVPLRYDSALLPLLPADTFIFAAVPNITREIADAGADLERRIQANPQLKSWFDQYRQTNPNAPDMVEVLARFRELGSYAGDEIVLAITGAIGEGHPSFLLLTEARDEAGLRAAIRDNLQRMRAQSGEEIPVVLVDDPASLPAQPGKALYVLVSGGLVVATDSTEEIIRLAGPHAGAPAAPASSPFFSQIARCYQDGVTWLFAADLDRLTTAAVARSTGGPKALIAEDLGLHDMQVVLVEHKRIASQSQLRGVLAFSRERRGVAGWLGSPAPMGALEYVSPNAYAVGCFLAKEPRQIADEVLAVMKQRDPEGLGKLADFESQHNFSLRDDLAAPLGGEFLVAIDGPVLPRPAWKLVVLVEDQARLQQAIEKIVAELNVRLAAEQKPTLALSALPENGTTFFTLTSSDGLVEVHYTFWDGYWLIAAQKVILTDAVHTRQSGMSLPATAVFRGALPVDGQQQYSALGFVNASSLGTALASAVPSGADATARAGLGELKKLLAEASAMTVCVTAEPDRIVLTSTGLDLLNPSRALSLLSGLGPSVPHTSAPAGGQSRPRVEI
ncbi:MAG TPA: FecR family protein [Thermoanaerobaculaceae bacterium]|nr:FecR family protein [Thermoanaerobaculaceae bacterium]